MDKEKLKKYAGYAGRYAEYAGLGILGGVIGVVIGFIPALFLAMCMACIPALDPRYYLDYVFNFEPINILIPIVGGCLGGAIAKKWRGALVGGFIAVGLYWCAIIRVNTEF